VVVPDGSAMNYKCPRCMGAKASFAFINRGDEPHEGKMVDCETCEATGEISAEKMHKIFVGKNLRSDRLQRGKSMSEEAHRLGITVTQYSALENGRTP